MNYLARICLGALSSRRFQHFSAFNFPLIYASFFLSFALLLLSAYFLTEPVPIAPGTFCRVSPAALGSHLKSQFGSQKLLPRKAYTF